MSSNFLCEAPIFKTRYRKKVDAVWNFTFSHWNFFLAVSGEKSRFWVWVTHACTYLPYVICVPMLKKVHFEQISTRSFLWCTRLQFFWKKRLWKNPEQKLLFLTEHTERVGCFCCGVRCGVIGCVGPPRRRWARVYI